MLGMSHLGLAFTYFSRQASPRTHFLFLPWPPLLGMCHLGLALNASERFPLLLVDNRDCWAHETRSQPPRLLDQQTGECTEPGVIAAIVGTGSKVRVWSAASAKTGRVAVLTNIGGRGGYGSRGKLCLLAVQDSAGEAFKQATSAQGRAAINGFNLVWGQVDARTGQASLCWTANGDPRDLKKGTGETHALGCLGPGRVVDAVGNDIVGDEFAKRHQAVRTMENVLSSLEHRAMDAHSAVWLRDALGDGFLSTVSPPLTLLCSKFLTWSTRRRLQPGARVAIGWSLLLAVMAAVLCGSLSNESRVAAARALPFAWLAPTTEIPMISTAALLGAGLGLMVGWWWHTGMNSLFVRIGVKHVLFWATVSQTVILVERIPRQTVQSKQSGLQKRQTAPGLDFDLYLHYFYRDTHPYDAEIGRWHGISLLIEIGRWHGISLLIGSHYD
eukprot:g14994.t1